MARISDDLTYLLAGYTMAERDYERGHSQGEDLWELWQEVQAQARAEGLSGSQALGAYLGVGRR